LTQFQNIQKIELFLSHLFVQIAPESVGYIWLRQVTKREPFTLRTAFQLATGTGLVSTLIRATMNECVAQNALGNLHLLSPHSRHWTNQISVRLFIYSVVWGGRQGKGEGASLRLQRAKTMGAEG